MACPIVHATASTALRSVFPPSPGGVPTVMKAMSARRTLPERSSVKLSRPSATLRTTISSRPGS